jgi:hypothetical protein
MAAVEISSGSMVAGAAGIGLLGGLLLLVRGLGDRSSTSRRPEHRP